MAQNEIEGTLRILIVEDNADVANSLADLLKSEGFEDVSISPDGETALASIRRTVPDLVLCDLGLPGSIDGYGVARACRREQSLQSVRLVAISGIGDTEARSKALDAGFDELLSKPIRLSVLSECVRGTR